MKYLQFVSPVLLTVLGSGSVLASLESFESYVNNNVKPQFREYFQLYSLQWCYTEGLVNDDVRRSLILELEVIFSNEPVNTYTDDEVLFGKLRSARQVSLNLLGQCLQESRNRLKPRFGQSVPQAKMAEALLLLKTKPEVGRPDRTQLHPLYVHFLQANSVEPRDAINQWQESMNQDPQVAAWIRWNVCKQHQPEATEQSDQATLATGGATVQRSLLRKLIQFCSAHKGICCAGIALSMLLILVILIALYLDTHGESKPNAMEVDALVWGVNQTMATPTSMSFWHRLLPNSLSFGYIVTALVLVLLLTAVYLAYYAFCYPNENRERSRSKSHLRRLGRGSSMVSRSKYLDFKRPNPPDGSRYADSHVSRWTFPSSAIAGQTSRVMLPKTFRQRFGDGSSQYESPSPSPVLPLRLSMAGCKQRSSSNWSSFFASKHDRTGSGR